MFNTSSPHNDAQDHIHWLDKQPTMIYDKVACDLCAFTDDRIEMIEAPDRHGYYCPGCLHCGDVESFLKRNTDLSKEEITNYLNQIKL